MSVQLGENRGFGPIRRNKVVSVTQKLGLFALVLAGSILAGCAQPASTPEATPVVLGDIDTSSSKVSKRQLARLKVPDTGDLIGKDGSELKTLFGDPTLARSERNAKVWQYEHGGCVLFFFLYEDALTARYSVTHVDARGVVGAGPAPIGDCVDHVFKSHYVAKAAL